MSAWTKKRPRWRRRGHHAKYLNGKTSHGKYRIGLFIISKLTQSLEIEPIKITLLVASAVRAKIGKTARKEEAAQNAEGGFPTSYPNWKEKLWLPPGAPPMWKWWPPMPGCPPIPPMPPAPPPKKAWKMLLGSTSWKPPPPPPSSISCPLSYMRRFFSSLNIA